MWLVPKRSVRDRVLLCLHGGGFVSGSIYTHRKMFGHLAKAAGVRALIFDYRLVPAHTHPAQVDDATDAYRWLLDQGIMQHTFQMAAVRAPEADDAIGRMAEWVRPELGI